MTYTPPPRNDLEAHREVCALARQIADLLAPSQSVFIRQKRGVVTVEYKPPIKSLKGLK